MAADGAQKTDPHTAERRAGAGAARYRAVVDIGSNSVRLVVYEGPLRAPLTICNEKALCGLGRDVAEGGTLNADAVDAALATLSRFRALLAAYGDPPTQAIATAAVRAAEDGPAFVDKVRALGIPLEVISGEEEAELAAYGVQMVEPRARGLAGDMGGGSLELVRIGENGPGESVSLQIGPLSLKRKVGDDLDAARGLIDKALGEVAFLPGLKGETLYAVGGAWRALARIHMNLRSYPLSVLHHYELTARATAEICDLVARQSRKSLEEIPGVSRKRIDALPHAAMALRALLERSGVARMVVSSGGVREGLLYRALSPPERAEDPLLALARFLSARYSPNPAYGAAAARFIAPLFEDDAFAAARLIEAVSELIDIAAYAHPDLRGAHAFDTALSTPFVGVSHQERAWIALALFCRYRGRSASFPDAQAVGLLDWDQQQSAMRAGLALRFAATLAPKRPKMLEGCRLEREERRLIFRAPTDAEALMGESPRKRFESLAASLDAEPMEIYEG